MTSLIELKEKLKNIYAEHETYLRLIFKFIAAFIALILIKSNIGFMKPINMWIVIAGAAVVCMGSSVCCFSCGYNCKCICSVIRAWSTDVNGNDYYVYTVL